MQDAWIYATSRTTAVDLGRRLAELGFSPRYVAAREGSLVPARSNGAAVREPAFAVVVAGPGEPVPDVLCAELRDSEELREVPLLLALEPEHLDSVDLAGAHELLVPPYSPAELRMRIARARSKAASLDEGEIVRAGSLELNLETYQVTIEGRVVRFAYMEYELLKFLLTHPGKVFSREALLTRVWGFDYYGGARTVDVHVRRIRAKLGQEHAARIKTVRSVGYLFQA